MAARNLWRPEIPVPGVLRWEPPGRQHPGAGNILALIAPPAAWPAFWPGLPAIQALQRIAVDRDGAPALDRPADAGGLGKRSLGPTAGGIVVIGCPLLDEALDPVRVAEGVADTLALASRYPGPAVATVGTEGMRDGALAAWLATAPAGVVVHADADAGKDGQGPAGTGGRPGSVPGHRGCGRPGPGPVRTGGQGRRGYRQGEALRTPRGRLARLRPHAAGHHRLASLGDRPAGRQRLLGG